MKRVSVASRARALMREVKAAEEGDASLVLARVPSWRVVFAGDKRFLKLLDRAECGDEKPLLKRLALECLKKWSSAAEYRAKTGRSLYRGVGAKLEEELVVFYGDRAGWIKGLR